MIADADRDIELLAARMRRPRQHREMMIGRDADKGPVAAERHQPRNRQVGVAAEPVLGDDRTGRDVGAGFLFEETRDRQFVGQRRIRDDLFLARRRRHHTMRQRLLDARQSATACIALDRAAQSHGKPWQRIEQIAYDRHRCLRRSPSTLRKMQRRSAVGLRKAAGDFIIQPDRLRNRDKFARRSQGRQERAHRLPGTGRLAVGGVLRLHVSRPRNVHEQRRIGQSGRA